MADEKGQEEHVRAHLLRRLLMAPLVLWLLITLSFFMMRFAPGSPFSGERHLDPVVEQALKKQFHLDRPLPEQYVRYLWELAHGRFGLSLKHQGRSVNEMIARVLPVSLLLGGLALFFAIFLGVGAGITAALHHNHLLDYGVMILAVLGISLPVFVIGPLLQAFFSMRLGILPLAGYEGLGAPVFLVLPSVTLALPFSARIARLTRTGMLEVMGQDFIRTARAKGLPETTIIFRHALRSGLLPVISYLGPAMAQMMTGSLVVERIFQIPGLGREFVEGALNRDYTLVMGAVIVYGLLLIACNIGVDLIYGVLNPRVTYE